MAGPSKGVATHHPGFDAYAPKWKRCRDVSDGQDAVHKAATAYLPKLKDETQVDYDARVKRSNFFNGTWRTLAVLNGMLFRKPPKMSVPAGIEDYLADVDLAGTSLDTFARCLALEVLEVGRIGILVDHQPMETDDKGNVVAISKAVAEQRGLRPSLQTYRAECIINWKCRRIRNRYVLAMVVLKESKPEPDGEFAEKQVDQYRVLDLDAADQYRVRIFQRIDEKDVQIGGGMYPLMNGAKLDYIPFAIVGTDGIETALDEPPLIDLVDSNVAHYQINADYRHGLHFTGLPTLFLAGMDPPTEGSERYYIGSSAAIQASHPDAKASFIEFQGKGLGELRTALDALKQEMAMLGARAIADETKQAETLGATSIKRSGENAILSSIALAVSEALEWALGVFAQWAGQPGDVEYQLNRDFMPALMTAQDLLALFAGVQGGHISEREAFDLLQRGDVIDPEISFEEHQANVEITAPAPARPDVKPGEAVAA
jgi:hypothetical protein